MLPGLYLVTAVGSPRLFSIQYGTILSSHRLCNHEWGARGLTSMLGMGTCLLCVWPPSRVLTEACCLQAPCFNSGFCCLLGQHLGLRSKNIQVWSSLDNSLAHFWVGDQILWTFIDMEYHVGWVCSAAKNKIIQYLMTIVLRAALFLQQSTLLSCIL